MIPSISELKIRRKTSGLTQGQLAELSGASQSLIAKIESGKISPGFEKVKLLFDCLDKLHEESTLTAGQVMRKHIYKVGPKDTAKKAVLLMEKHSFSQLPVIAHDKSIGTITEKAVLAGISRSTGAVDLSKIKVLEIMEDALPVIQENSPVKLVYAMLNFHEAVLASKKGRITGIITKSDLLKMAAKGK